MEVIGILLFFLLIGPLAMLFGADSRTWDERGWWPGSPPRSDEPLAQRAPVDPVWGEVAMRCCAPAGCASNARSA